VLRLGHGHAMTRNNSSKLMAHRPVGYSPSSLVGKGSLEG
jgi:hypothetical protein